MCHRCQMQPHNSSGSFRAPCSTSFQALGQNDSHYINFTLRYVLGLGTLVRGVYLLLLLHTLSLVYPDLTLYPTLQSVKPPWPSARC